MVIVVVKCMVVMYCIGVTYCSWCRILVMMACCDGFSGGCGVSMVIVELEP